MCCEDVLACNFELTIAIGSFSFLADFIRLSTASKRLMYALDLYEPLWRIFTERATSRDDGLSSHWAVHLPATRLVAIAHAVEWREKPQRAWSQQTADGLLIDGAVLVRLRDLPPARLKSEQRLRDELPMLGESAGLPARVCRCFEARVHVPGVKVLGVCSAVAGSEGTKALLVYFYQVLTGRAPRLVGATAFPCVAAPFLFAEVWPTADSVKSAQLLSMVVERSDGTFQRVAGFALCNRFMSSPLLEPPYTVSRLQELHRRGPSEESLRLVWRLTAAAVYTLPADPPITARLSPFVYPLSEHPLSQSSCSSGLRCANMPYVRHLNDCLGKLELAADGQLYLRRPINQLTDFPLATAGGSLVLYCSGENLGQLSTVNNATSQWLVAVALTDLERNRRCYPLLELPEPFRMIPVGNEKPPPAVSRDGQTSDIFANVLGFCEKRNSSPPGVRIHRFPPGTRPCSLKTTRSGFSYDFVEAGEQLPTTLFFDVKNAGASLRVEHVATKRLRLPAST